MNIFNDNSLDKIDDDMKFSDSIFLFKVVFFLSLESDSYSVIWYGRIHFLRE